MAVGHHDEARAHAGDLNRALGTRLFLNFRSRKRVPAATQILKLPLLRELLHQGHHSATHIVVQNAQRSGNLLVIQSLARTLTEYLKHRFAEVGARAII